MLRCTLMVLLLSCLILCPAAQASAEKIAADRVFASLLTLAGGAPKTERPASFEEPLVFFIKPEPSDPWVMGVLRVMRIRAPIQKMSAVVDNPAGYVGLFKNLLTAKRTDSRGMDGFVLFTETRIPLPFVSNDQTSVRYSRKKLADRIVTSFELVESNHLSALDGASSLFASGKAESLYWQLDFVKVGYGAARMLPPKKFWVENAIGNLQAGWALKLSAEQPELKPEEVLKRSEEFSRSQSERLKDAFVKPLSLEELLGALSETPKAP